MTLSPALVACVGHPSSASLFSTSPEEGKKWVECGWGCSQTWCPEHLCWGQGVMGVTEMALEDQDLCPYCLLLSHCNPRIMWPSFPTC